MFAVVCALSMYSDAKAKKAAKAKQAKGSQRHNQGGNKQQYARPTSRGGTVIHTHEPRAVRQWTESVSI